MDKCQFSEFTYGYCLTEDLIVGQGTPLTAAPVFPSLIEEGQPGNGYDVHLDRPGVPLFLQFKLVEQMVRGNANEARAGHYQAPFYRMHLRPTGVSDQHPSLLSLEAAGNEVFYVAPGFHTVGDLNDAYAQRQVWNRSFRIRPSVIGTLPDDNAHHITFKTIAGTWRRYSETPTKEGVPSASEEINDTLERRIHERGERNLKDQIVELDASIINLIRQNRIGRRGDEQLNVDQMVNEGEPLRRVALIARQFFDCQLFFVTRKP